MSIVLTRPQRTIRVSIPQSTAASLYALAQANKTTVEKLFTQFAEAMADDAGRREGSWEAESVNRFCAAFAPRYPVSTQLMVMVQTGGWFRGFVRGQRFAWPVVKSRGSYRIGGDDAKH